MTAALPVPTVLLYCLRDPARRQRILSWLERAGVRPVEVPPEDWQKPIGTLLGLPLFSPAGAPAAEGAVEEEMLVMFAFRPGMLDAFLRFFREEGLAPVALKAMATPTNLNWSSAALYRALREEHHRLQTAAQKRSSLH